MSKPTYVLGTGLSHNGSACLLKDGKIVVAIEKERITRLKNDGFNDNVAIKYCLDAEGIGWGDIDLVVQNTPFGGLEFNRKYFHGARAIPDGVEIVTISHHLAHAYSVYYASDFDSATILVTDSLGNAASDCTDITSNDVAKFEIVSIYNGINNHVETVHKQFGNFCAFTSNNHPLKTIAENSLGGAYDSITQYVFDNHSDAGQLMGLAAYGKPGLLKEPLFDFVSGEVVADNSLAKNFLEPAHSAEDFKNRFQYFADVARYLQDELSRMLVRLVEYSHDITGNDTLCYAGGVALNCVANSEFAKNTKFKNVFISPVANDVGISVGCAYYGWHKVLGNDKTKSNWSVYSGKPYDKHYEEVLALLGQLQTSIKVERPDNLNTVVAKFIAEGKVVGWYKGRSEMGPRALGHRSLLGNPCDPGMKDHINNSIKSRPDFRPFAPSVLAEDAGIYFDIDRDSPHMLMVFPVREGWLGKIPAVTHEDGTARVQTVRETDDKEFYDLLKEVKRETGIGMVLNTSFNRRHEPMVEKPDEAVQMFMHTPMDALVLGPYLLTK